MAPSAAKPLKRQQKLSQTRLLTPQKKPAPGPRAQTNTGANTSSPFPTTGRPSPKTQPKQKPKPNQSILSFFKKEAAPAGTRDADDGLFIGGGAAAAAAGELWPVGEDEDSCEGGGGGLAGLEAGDGDDTVEGMGDGEGVEDLYGASPPRKGGSGGREGEEERFNEVEGSVKRRKVMSAGLGGGSGSELGLEGSRSSSAAVEGPAVATRRPVEKKRAKKAGNPFLDDDSSDDDEENNKENEPSATDRVRSPPPVFDDPYEQDPCSRPARLTSGESGSREVPLLRQQTSGADSAGGDSAERPDSGVVGPTEDEEFTGEELLAMRYMEEQARLEAEAEGEEYTGLNSEGNDEPMTESCPVCNGSLAGATPDQATAHVNSCLDGNPTPLPRPPGDVIEAEAAIVGKRFAKAAVARPGQPNPISLGDDAGEGSASSAFTKLMSGHAEDAAWATAAAAENASRGMPAYKRTCPFYKIMPGFSICVDAFRYGAVEGCQAYFLSHFHSDHYIGLTASWTHGPIYCSKVTGSLVKSQLKTAAKYVVELEFEKTVPVPQTNGVTVTMIPANHCPGSSLFLFEKTTGGRTQRILHCGDFRACPAHVEHPKLRPETVDAISGRTKQQKIDVCYLDTTYLNPRYSFPPQDEVVDACAELCAQLNKGLLADDDREWDALLRRRERGTNGSAGTESVTKFFTATASSSSASPAQQPTPPPPDNAFTALNGKPHNPNRLLVVCGTYSIGKERICVAIAKALRSKIYATPAKIRMCAQLDDAELSALLTPNPSEAQVHMQMLMEIRAETLAEYLAPFKARGEFARIVGIRPSGWNYRPPPPGSSSFSPSTATAAGTNKNNNNSTATATAKGSLANLSPTALPTAQLLHGPRWRTHFTARDLAPQRGSSREALCLAVPYSEHSSFRELALFVMALRIERVVPTVNVGSEAARRRMKGWIDRWLAERRRGGFVRVLKGGGEENGTGEVVLWEGKDGRGGGVYW
ncbi:uncharacterized protein THITE_2112528 [Thermothielavioides terrestris NRRL 8126]|uniref:DNA repair metallo-beta-lactamase domain-containing protein n=1 Tax=Thermothielavioides terrestris (strain ATCC 38088 / NRRL 8126) TaxID=578455 RepID=G2QZF7_THETT|nr:uncharacterized protein THITE_2112528 [Thermothielavioides terrestris NRRL 8126]AEO65483.1 hypothetical protein THITE_2112528 [Thermothielavioides terrestris NRRL 8126]